VASDAVRDELRWKQLGGLGLALIDVAVEVDLARPVLMPFVLCATCQQHDER
jgi:hypothetical protein